MSSPRVGDIVEINGRRAVVQHIEPGGRVFDTPLGEGLEGDTIWYRYLDEESSRV